MQNKTIFTIIPSPLGDILLARNERGLTHVSFQAGTSAVVPTAVWQRDDTAFADATAQLNAYFAAELREFDLPIAPAGTPFQQEVWRALQTIPYGTTVTYGALAVQLGRPITAARAVGAANGQNPLPIIIPCHRVIGANGQLTGFRGGLRFKEALLALEGNGRLRQAQFAFDF